MYNQTSSLLTAFVVNYEAVFQLNMSPPPPPPFLMLMSLPYGTGDCTLSAPSQVWIWGTEPYVRVQCYIVFIFGLQHECEKIQYKN